MLNGILRYPPTLSYASRRNARLLPMHPSGLRSPMPDDASVKMYAQSSDCTASNTEEYFCRVNPATTPVFASKYDATCFSHNGGTTQSASVVTKISPLA